MLMFCVRRVFSLHPLERFLPSAQRSLELACLDRFKNLAKFWARPETESDQIVPAYQWRRNNWFVSKLFAFAKEKFVIVEHAMATLAIDPMQLELGIEGRSRHETLQLRHPHLGHVFKNHVLPDHLDRGFDFSARKPQTPHDFFGDLSAETIMPAETNSPRFIHGRRTRLGDVMKQDRENEWHRNVLRQEIQH